MGVFPLSQNIVHPGYEAEESSIKAMPQPLGVPVYSRNHHLHRRIGVAHDRHGAHGAGDLVGAIGYRLKK